MKNLTFFFERQIFLFQFIFTFNLFILKWVFLESRSGQDLEKKNLKKYRKLRHEKKKITLNKRVINFFLLVLHN